MPKKNTSAVGAGIASMTGFGHSSVAAPGRQIGVEIRSVNNRFLEVGLKTPRELNALEGDVRDFLRSRLQRGRLSVLVTLDRDAGQTPTLNIDVPAARICYERLEELNHNLGFEGPVGLEQLLTFSDYFTLDPRREADEELKKLVLQALETAVEDLNAMRRAEGVSLAQDLLDRLAAIEAVTGEIEGLAADQPQQQMQKLKERLELLTAPGPLDAGRLETELALMADRLDITEETVRLRTHCQAFREAIAGKEAPGKRLGFLLQEMNREANTIGSKAALADISHRAIRIKEELERMREQIQNLE